MRITNPFDALALGLCLATASIVSLNISETLILHGYRVATAVAMVVWVVLAAIALWWCKKALLITLRLLDDAIIDYQVRKYPLVRGLDKALLPQ